MSEIDYFSRLGSMLGYHTFTEDTCDGTYRAMDLTWWEDPQNDSWNDFALHLERENLLKKDEETLEKLYDDRQFIPHQAVGMMNTRDHSRIEELLDLAQEIASIEQSLLVFRTNSNDNTKYYFDKVHAYKLERNQIVHSKIAKISDFVGNLYMYYEDENI